MKGLICTTLAITGLLGIVGVQTARAQVDERLRFTTSFPFSIGTTTFPAGSYVVSPAADGNFGVLRISSMTGRKVAFMPVIPDRTTSNEPKDNELTFDRLGDTYVLRQIWDADDQSAVEPTNVAAELRNAPEHNRVAERVTVPYSKIS